MKSLSIFYCKCGEEVKADSKVESVTCWRCLMESSIRYEKRKLRPLAEYYSPDQICEYLYKGKIKDIRDKMKYSKAKMAESLGLSITTYSKYERFIIPKSKTLKMVENFLKSKIDSKQLKVA